jgi:hypothetical protein
MRLPFPKLELRYRLVSKMVTGEKMSKATCMAVVSMEFEPQWLGLSREERRGYASQMDAILKKHPDVQVRWFDSDALGTGFSDFVMCEFHELEHYHFLWEELRDTVVFSMPYLRIKSVMLGIERGYERYEATQP